MSDNTPMRPPVPDAAEIREWLNYEYAGLIHDIAECRLALQSIIDKHPDGLPDDEIASVAGQNLAIVAAKLTGSEERRLEENSAYRAGQKIINDWFADFVSGPIAAAREQVQSLQNKYGAEKRRRAQQAAEEARKMAELVAKRASEEAARALREGRPDALGQVENAGRMAERLQEAAEKAEGSAATFTRMRGPMGAVSSGTVTWGWEVEDFSVVPDFYKCIDEGKIRVVAKKRGLGGKPVAVIPGIKWVEKFAMRNR